MVSWQKCAVRNDINVAYLFPEVIMTSNSKRGPKGLIVGMHEGGLCIPFFLIKKTLTPFLEVSAVKYFNLSRQPKVST
jgi:hypothetical protein